MKHFTCKDAQGQTPPFLMFIWVEPNVLTEIFPDFSRFLQEDSFIFN
jgi:hypothetical protein